MIPLSSPNQNKIVIAALADGSSFKFS